MRRLKVQLLLFMLILITFFATSCVHTDGNHTSNNQIGADNDVMTLYTIDDFQSIIVALPMLSCRISRMRRKASTIHIWMPGMPCRPTGLPCLPLSWARSHAGFPLTAGVSEAPRSGAVTK